MGSGGGTVTLSPAGTSCGTDCLAYYSYTTIQVTESANLGSEFAGWSGTCSGMGACNMEASITNQYVTATFNQSPVYFSGAESPLGSGVSSPSGVAVNGSGNVYIADTYNNRVLMETLSWGSYTQSTITTSALNSPLSVAADGAGNVYIADTYNNRVLKETPSAGSYIESVVASSGLNDPSGVAVDGNGNVYIADTRNSRVLKETLSAGSYTQSVVASGASGGLIYPDGVAVDGSGNVYIADTYNNRVVMETLSAGNYTQSTVVTGLNHPAGVTVNGSGRVYAADTGNSRVVMETPATGSYSQSTVVSSSLSLPAGVAVDGSGNIYIADTNNNRVMKDMTSSANLGTVNVGTKSPASSLFFTFNAAGTPAGTAVSTQGAPGLDFTDAGTGSCKAGTSYPAGATCTVNVSFAPSFVGSRYGAVILTDSYGNVLTTGYLQGAGLGPQVNFLPATQSTIANGLSYPTGIAADGFGNVYIADTENFRVLKETISAGNYTQSTVVSQTGFPSGYYEPQLVAVDGSGNVYITAEWATNWVLKETLVGGSYAPYLVPTSTLSNPEQIAVDGSGNIYIADSGNNRVLKETLQPSGTYTESTIVSALNSPDGVATDGNGNVYIADTGNSRILKETPSGASYLQSTIVSGGCYTNGFCDPYMVTVDGSGNVYFKSLNRGVLKETPSAGGYIQSTVSTGAVNPMSIAVDGGGNFYALDYDNGLVAKENSADAPSLSFAATGFGSTSSDSPQTVTVENIGTAALSFPVPGAGNNPSMVGTNFSLNTSGASACPLVTASSSVAGTLAPGASCLLPLSFTPAAVGSLSGSLTLTDNTLNASTAPTYAAQSIDLSGTGIQSTPVITWATSALITYGSNLSTVLTATAQSGSATIPGTFSYTATPVGGTAAAVIKATILATGSYTLNVSFTPTDTTDYATATGTATLVVNPATLTVTATSLSMTYGETTLPPLSYTITGFLNGDTEAGATTGAPRMTATAASSPQAGSYPIDAAPGTLSAANYIFSFVNGTLTVNPLPLMVAANNQMAAFGAAIPALTGTLTEVISGDGITASYATTAVQGSAVGSYPITAALNDPNKKLSNYSVTMTNGTLVVYQTSLPVALWMSSNTATAGSAGFMLTVTGPNFTPTSVVLWNGAVRATTYVSSTQLTAAISAADIANEGTDLVTVANFAPNPGTSPALPFVVVSSTPVAAISGGSIVDTADGGGNYMLSLLGADFVSKSTVQWNGVALTTTYASPWQITAVIPAPAYALLPVPITVLNPAGSSAAFQMKTAVPITVTISPVSALLQVGASQQFTATVTGTLKTGILWSVNVAAGMPSGSGAGAITTSGLYTAPPTVPTANPVKVIATSAADASETSTALVTIASAIYNLTLSTTGTGGGTITPNPVGISCGSKCYSYASGTVVQLTAGANPGSAFAGWGGACSGTGACSVTMSSSKTVSATFNLVAIYNLTLSITGSGTITPSPLGTSCGTNCYAYSTGTVVQLTAQANTGSTFAGWGGACSGTGACSVTMSSSKTVSATFNLVPIYNLTLSTTGNGGGTITPKPVGTSCGTNCYSYSSGTVVQVTASASAGSTFAGWGGACSGTGACSVTMSSTRNVSATFTQIPVSYSLTLSTTGGGKITPNPLGTSCGTNCYSYTSATVVQVTETPNSGYTFAGWGGACSGTGSCSVTMSAARSVSATFTPTPVYYNLTLTTTNGGGLLTPNPTGTSCGTNCYTYPAGTVVQVTPYANAGSIFVAWSGACSGVGTCSVTMNSNQTVTATFVSTGGGGTGISGTWIGNYSFTTDFSYLCSNLTTPIAYSGTVTMVISEDELDMLTGTVSLTNMTVASVDYSNNQCTLATLLTSDPIVSGGGMVAGSSVQVNTDMGPSFGSYWGTNQMLYFTGTLNGSSTIISGNVNGMTDGGTSGTTGTFSITKQ